jgi:hypothetical protein
LTHQRESDENFLKEVTKIWQITTDVSLNSRENIFFFLVNFFANKHLDLTKITHCTATNFNPVSMPFDD